MPELEEQAVTSSSPLIASETIEETTIRIADEGDMMNGANDKVSDDPGENPNKMMYTSNEESEFYETSPETTTDDTDILPRQILFIFHCFCWQQLSSFVAKDLQYFLLDSLELNVNIYV